MANITGEQPEVLYCPKCKGNLVNVPRNEMKSKNKKMEDKPTHTYRCIGECKTHFEINQHR